MKDSQYTIFTLLIFIAVIFLSDIRTVKKQEPPIFNPTISKVALLSELPPDDLNTFRTLVTSFSAELPENLEENGRLARLSSHFDKLAINIHDSSIMAHGYITPNDYEEFKKWQKVAKAFKDYK